MVSKLICRSVYLLEAVLFGMPAIETDYQKKLPFDDLCMSPCAAYTGTLRAAIVWRNIAL